MRSAQRGERQGMRVVSPQSPPIPALRIDRERAGVRVRDEHREQPVLAVMRAAVVRRQAMIVRHKRARAYRHVVAVIADDVLATRHMSRSQVVST